MTFFSKQTFLIVAIALLFALFIGYGIEVFHKAPDFQACYDRMPKIIPNETSCTSMNGTWNKVEGGPGYCDYQDPCYTGLQETQEAHNRIVFIVSLVVGVVALIVMLLLKVEIISTGISAGAIILLLYGTVRYWQYADDLLRFGLVGVALAILLYVAYTKLDRNARDAKHKR